MILFWFKYMLMILYLDPLIRICVSSLLQLCRENEMSMMEELNYFLGLQSKQLNHGTFLSQTKYCKELLKKFDMEIAKRFQHLWPLIVTWIRMRKELVWIKLSTGA